MYYHNGAGRCYLMPELPLEPPDCWAQYEPEEVDDDDNPFTLREVPESER